MLTPGPSPFSSPMPDLAPMIHRQRMVVEGTVRRPIGSATICGFLRELGEVIDMTVLTEPVTHCSPRYGWAGWVHWETSGAHFYAWERPVLFFSLDIYSCKPFAPTDVVRFTRLHLDTVQVAARSI